MRPVRPGVESGFRSDGKYRSPSGYRYRGYSVPRGLRKAPMFVASFRLYRTADELDGTARYRSDGFEEYPVRVVEITRTRFAFGCSGIPYFHPDGQIESLRVRNREVVRIQELVHGTDYPSDIESHDYPTDPEPLRGYDEDLCLREIHGYSRYSGSVHLVDIPRGLRYDGFDRAPRSRSTSHYVRRSPGTARENPRNQYQMGFSGDVPGVLPGLEYRIMRVRSPDRNRCHPGVGAGRSDGVVPAGS